MKKIFDTVKATLEGFELHFSEENDVIRTGVRGDNTNMTVQVVTDEEKELLFVNTSLPQKIGETNYAKVLRWINSTNYHLVLGFFTLDEEDGELSFRVTLTLDDGAVNDKIIAAALLTAMNTCDTKYPELMRLIFAADNESQAPVTNDADATTAFTHTHFNS